MKKSVVMLALTVLISATATAQAQQAETQGFSGFLPGDLFYPVESFVEDLEVSIAGIVGGKDFKSKAIANNADEALNKARILADNNQSEKAVEMVDRYSKLINQSRNLAAESENTNLSNKLKNISDRNVDTLEQVREKVPEKAIKGIEKAIENSKRDKKLEYKAETEKNGKTPKSNVQNKSSDNKINPRENQRLMRENLSENKTEKPQTGEKALNNSKDSGENETDRNDTSSEKDSREKNRNTKENPLTGRGSGIL